MSVEAYHSMIEAGTLGEDDPAELIEGVLVVKRSRSKGHRRMSTRVNRWLVRVLPSGWASQAQDPITLSNSEPEPDASCVTEASIDQADWHPTPPDVALVIGIADSSLRRDRGVKLRMYARVGIPEYWIINLVDRQIELHTRPLVDAYASCAVYALTGTIALPATLGSASIAVADLLPPA